ncbi:MAG: WXG100 family type VII secretion target [Bifidobacteriaceae bacterium]|jgi:WXG100 family type VII secretion target|nr:WXG100 family type VII secretion target [Bifidobacteriaceae bacterium]
MSAPLLIAYSEVDAHIKRLKDHLLDLNRIVDDLDTSARTLEKEWSGAARTAYLTAHRSWTSSMRAMNTALEHGITKLRTAREGLEDADTIAAASWRGR